jgi:hypothetical protein
MSEDFRVPSLSNGDLESIAQAWREALVGSSSRFDVFQLLDKASREFRQTQGLELIPKPDAEMGGRLAYAISTGDLLRIFAAQSVIDQAGAGIPRAITTLIHELFHIILHPGAAPKARMATTNKTPEYIAPYESAEHQARVATAEFQMPRKEVLKLSSAWQIQEQFGVSSEAALYRYREVLEKVTPREIPNLPRLYLAERKIPKPVRFSAPSTFVPVRSKTRERTIWDAAPVAADHDPSEYRLSRRGFLVRQCEYLKMTPLGWSIVGEQICAFLETDAASQVL